MSDFLAAAAAAVGAPEEMVMRSATARAAAQGVTVDDILAAWGGGAAAPAAPAPAAPVEAVADTPAEAAAPVAVPEPARAAEPVAEAPIAAVAVMAEPEPQELIEPASLRDRMIIPGKLGAMLGAMFGIFLSVAAAPYVLDHVRLVGEDESVRAVIEVTGGSLTLWLAAVSAVIGGVIGRLSGVVPGWIDKGLSVRTSPRSLAIVGTAVGTALGIVGAGVLLAIGETIESFEEGVADTVQLSTLDTFVTLIVGGAILGAITAIVAQISSLPDGLTDTEKDESEVIKHRLVTSYIMPAVMVITIAIVVVAFGSLLLAFHNIAWVLAMVAASGILAFASLSATRPTMKITKGEFLVAAAAVATVLLFIVLLANANSGAEQVEEEAVRFISQL